MAIKKISELPALSGDMASNDLLVIVDASETTQTNKTKRANANQIKIFDSNQLLNNVVSENAITTGAVTNGKIANNAVTNAKIANSSISSTKISENAVTNEKLASNAVTADKIDTFAVTVPKLAGLNSLVSLNKFVYVDSSETFVGIEHGFSIVNNKIVDKAIVSFIIYEETEPLESGQKKLLWVVPPNFDGYKITETVANVMTASTSGLVQIDVRRGRRSSATASPSYYSIFSTRLTIDVGEFSSRNAVTPPVIRSTYSVVNADDVLSFDVTATGTNAKYLCVSLEFSK